MSDGYAPPPGPPPTFQSNNPFRRHHSPAPPLGPPPSHQQDDYVPPPGPPPSHSQTQDQFVPPPGPPPSRQQDGFAPPPGPPPSRQQDDFAPPPGPPPSRQHVDFVPPPGPPPSRQQENYAPPPGPPPSRLQESYVPPLGPPPKHQNQDQPLPGPPPGYSTSSSSYDAPPPGPPPPQHDWQSVVPDTSELPPPPSLFDGYDRSPANNATAKDADDAELWCRSRPLSKPVQLDQPALDALRWGNVALLRPPTMAGAVTSKQMGHWHAKTKHSSPDSLCVSSLPLYSALAHSPNLTEVSKTSYFEVRILSRRPEVSLSLGFVAQPYPPFRLPGWERASLGVHGDDGHRYVNDNSGGRDFTAPFKPGQTVGIGMTFSLPTSASGPAGKTNMPPAYAGGNGMGPAVVNVEVFFTRDGKKEGGWDVHEELDFANSLPITGLEGMHDLYAAVGTFEDVEFEVIFTPSDWKYKPKRA